jgi:hypothetical protein
VARGAPAEITGAFPRRVAEVRGPDLRAARARLRESGPPGVDVHRLGDRLHVVHDAAVTHDDLARCLAGVPVDVAEIPPSLTDVFVAGARDTPAGSP